LPNLSVEGSSRCEIYDRASATVLIQWLLLGHLRRCATEHVERANQIDLDNKAKFIERKGLAIAAHGTARGTQACRIHTGTQWAECCRSGDCCIGIFDARYVALYERAANLISNLLTALLIEVGNDDLRA
jgi:hypothetical protein